MNIQEYISSGILESYLLDQLTDPERRQVEAMAANHSEIKTELEAIEDALNNYATANSKTPPTRLKQQILSKINVRENTGKVIPIAKTNFQTWIAAASVILLIGSGIYNYRLLEKFKTGQDQLSSITKEKEDLAQQLQAEKSKYQQSANEMAMLMETNNKMVHLKGMKMAPAATAMIVWNQQTQDVYISTNSLPIPSPDKQYQLWAIVDGKPVDEGVFDMNDGTITPLQKMKSIAGATAFAVTLEKKGGSPNPTMEAMYLMGNV